MTDLLYTSDATLDWLVEGVIERNHHYAETGEDIDKAELVERGDGKANAELRVLWIKFETALRSALYDWASAHARYRPEGYASAEAWVEAMVGEDAAYAVFMTLNGEGVGIWDGRWEHLFDERNGSVAVDTLGDYLEERLGEYADNSGGGSLNEAMENCTYLANQDE